jgi:hypothetical protein
MWRVRTINRRGTEVSATHTSFLLVSMGAGALGHRGAITSHFGRSSDRGINPRRAAWASATPTSDSVSLRPRCFSVTAMMSAGVIRFLTGRRSCSNLFRPVTLVDLAATEIGLATALARLPVAVPVATAAAALPTAGRSALHSSISKGCATVRRNFRPCVSFTTGPTAAVNFRPWNGTAKPTTMTGVAAVMAHWARVVSEDRCALDFFSTKNFLRKLSKQVAALNGRSA